MEDLQDTFIVHTIEEIRVCRRPSSMELACTAHTLPLQGRGAQGSLPKDVLDLKALGFICFDSMYMRGIKSTN